MKRILVWILAAAMVLSLAGCSTRSTASSESSSSEKTAEIFAMDTVMDFSVYGSKAKTVLKKSEKEINRLEDLLSRTKDSSEISKINQNSGSPVTVDKEVASLIAAALHYSALTDGAFDITVAPVVSAWGFTTETYQVPSQKTLNLLLKKVDYRRVNVKDNTVTVGSGQSLDLGGIAKGYASDQIAKLYKKAGVTSGKIYLGGNVWVCGKKPDGSLWRVAIQDPKDKNSYLGILKLENAYAVTSGGYQRYFKKNGKIYHHIIDPSTGTPADNGLISTTIISSDNGTMCDALSTAIFVMGAKKGLKFWRESGLNFGMVLVTSDGRVLVTRNISGKFEKEKGSGYQYEVVS